MCPHQELTEELEEKQDVLRALQDSAELLSLENHPAKQTVEVGHGWEGLLLAPAWECSGRGLGKART